MASHSLLSCPSISLSVPKLTTFSPIPIKPFSLRYPTFSKLRVQVSPAETATPAPVESQIAAESKSIEKKKQQDVFAVVMVGSRQYIVYPGRFLYTQRLKGANVNDKIILNKVLLVGTRTDNYIGTPVVTNAAVHAVVEEQCKDKKVIIFKYKRKKNYRRTIGHRQPITKLKIVGITGYEDYKNKDYKKEAIPNPLPVLRKNTSNVAVAA